MQMICQKHPTYKGMRKPTTQLTKKDGCTCHEIWNKLTALTRTPAWKKSCKEKVKFVNISKHGN